MGSHKKVIGGSRVDAFGYAPHDLVLITDKKDPLYDERVEDEVTDEDVLNFATHGQLQNLVVRVRGNDTVVVVGRQRTKRALIINDLVGAHAYKGHITSVLQAIRRIKANEDLTKAIISVCTRGIKRLTASMRNSGTDGTALGVATVENEYREDDPLERKIRRAQRLAELGVTVPEMCTMFRAVHRTTIQRWLKMNLSAPAKKKDRAKRPNGKQVAELYDTVKKEGTKREQEIVAWFLGKGDKPDFA